MEGDSLNVTGNVSDALSREISITEYHVTAVFITGLIIATVVGNFMVILCFILERAIRTFNNVFILSLAIADLLVGVIIMPLTLLFDLTGHWTFGAPMCDAWQYLDAVCCCCSILNLCAISMVRYLSITHPLKYSSVIKTPAKGIMIVGAVWALALLLNSPTLFGWQFRHPHLKCVVRKNHVVYIIYSALTTYFLPLGLILFASASIIVALRKSRRKIGILPPKVRQTNHGGGRASVDVSSCATTSAASNCDRSCFNISNIEGNGLTVAGTSTSRNVLSPNVFVTASSAKGPIVPKTLLTPSSGESTQASPVSTPETILTPTTITSGSAAPSSPSSNNDNLNSNTAENPSRKEKSPRVQVDKNSETKPSTGLKKDSVEAFDIEAHDNGSEKAKIISVGIAPMENNSEILSSLGGVHKTLTSVELATPEVTHPSSSVICHEHASSIPRPGMPHQHYKDSLLDETSVDESQDGSQSHKSLNIPTDTATFKSGNFLSPPSLLTTSDRPTSPSNSAATPTPADLKITELSPSVIISEATCPSEKAVDSKQSASDSVVCSLADQSQSAPTSKEAFTSNPDNVNFLTPSVGLKSSDRSPSPCSSTDANFLSPGFSSSASRPTSPISNSVSAVRLSFISRAETVIRKDNTIGISDVSKATDLSMRVITSKFNQLKVTTDVVIGGNRMTGKTGAKARYRLRDMRERRAVKSLAVIAIFFTVCWTPFYFVYVVAHFCKWCNVPRYMMTFTIWLGYSNSCLNPILYTVFNSAFKEAFINIWSRIKSACKIR